MEQAQRSRSSQGNGKGSRIARLSGAVLLSLAFLGAPARAEGAPACSNASARLKGQSAIPALAGKLSRHQPIRILAIGSSSTEGIGASSPDHTYPAQLEDDLAALWKEPVSVVNSGKGGETVVQTIERLEAALKADKYDLVIWQVGTNDAINGVDESAFRALLERGISAVRQAGTEMVLLDQQYFPSIKDPARYERFVSAVSATGRERKVGVFSRYALMKEWNSRSPEELRAMLSADGFHMGDKGYDRLADCMADALQAMVEHSVAEARPTVTAVASVRDR